MTIDVLYDTIRRRQSEIPESGIQEYNVSSPAYLSRKSSFFGAGIKPLSLLPTNCIILLKKDALVESLDKALAEVTKDELPTNIIFIMGPSRTADIELITVLGVHGPQNVHVVLY